MSWTGTIASTTLAAMGHARVTLQTFLGGRWHDAATVDFADAEAGHLAPAALQYFDAYALEPFAADSRGLAAVSVAAPVDLERRRWRTWPPFLVDLLPQGHARKMLAEAMGLPPDADGTDFPLLLRAAGSPVGNLRVKEAWEAEQARLQAAPIGGGLRLDDVFERREAFLQLAADFAVLASGSSGVQGAWPKLLLTQDADGLWLPDPVVPDAAATGHALVKWVADRREESRLILASEAPYLELARRFGVTCGPPLLHRNGVLAIPRFDRTVAHGAVVRLGQESIASASGLAGFGQRASHEAYLATIKSVCDDPAAAVTEYVLRDVLNLALGNPDNHGRNTALQKTVDGAVRLTPLFDFAPMAMDPEGIARATQWRCMAGRDFAPDWPTICAVAAEGVMDAGDLLAVLASKADLLRSLPEEARRLGVQDPVIARAMSRCAGIADTLDAIRLRPGARHAAP